MGLFNQLLRLDQSVAQLVERAGAGTGSSASLVEQVQSQVCDNASLYATKYEAEFTPYLDRFVSDVWEMLVSIGDQGKCDMVGFGW